MSVCVYIHVYVVWCMFYVSVCECVYISVCAVSWYVCGEWGLWHRCRSQRRGGEVKSQFCPLLSWV